MSYRYNLPVNVPSVSDMMKHPSIFFMNARMPKIYGTNFDYIFQKKLHYQFEIHRLTFSALLMF